MGEVTEKIYCCDRGDYAVIQRYKAELSCIHS